MRALLLLLALCSMAHADERACDRARSTSLSDGPVVIGLYDADLGAGLSACLRREVSLYERAGAIYDVKGLYGDIRADTLLNGIFPLGHHVALLATIEVVHYELVVNSIVKAHALGLGQSTLGLAGRVLETSRFALTAYGRALVPTDASNTTVQTTGLDAGVTGTFRPRRDIELHAQLDGDFTVGLADGPSSARGGATVLVGAQYSPARWFGVVVDVGAMFGHRGAFDAFLPSLGLRFRVWRGIGLELDAVAPVAGAERRLALAALHLHFRF
ncbi:MAG: hypothetical protein ABI321_08695 [Polyangia bacterium]